MTYSRTVHLNRLNYYPYFVAIVYLLVEGMEIITFMKEYQNKERKLVSPYYTLEISFSELKFGIFVWFVAYLLLE